MQAAGNKVRNVSSKYLNLPSDMPGQNRARHTLCGHERRALLLGTIRDFLHAKPVVPGNHQGKATL